MIKEDRSILTNVQEAIPVFDPYPALGRGLIIVRLVLSIFSEPGRVADPFLAVTVSHYCKGSFRVSVHKLGCSIESVIG